MDYEALQNLPPCVAIKFKTFLENPDMLYELTGLPKTMIVNLTSKEDRSVKVDSAEELQRVTEDLLHKPLLFYCSVQHQITEKSPCLTEVRTWRALYAVLINPWHPAIQEFLYRLLTEASDHVNAGEKFCLKIKFGKCVKDWFRKNVDDGSDCNEKKTTLSGMGLRIYNYSTPLKVCSNPWMIVFCFPCWFLFGGPCYLVQRKVRFYDRREKLSGISVSFLTEEAEKICTMTSRRRRNTRAVAPIND
ncbi:uncharacterized protein LOC143066367 [Mytilus galloprovincialis]|uniref:uncharacterized protein LOC143066367 n=1 Tax=Mytilus galloprovincialis TaxID=29158 RepID=UPI003F7C4C41